MITMHKYSDGNPVQRSSDFREKKTKIIISCIDRLIHSMNVTNVGISLVEFFHYKYLFYRDIVS